MDINTLFKKHWFLILFIAIIFLIVWYASKGTSKKVTYYETNKDTTDGWSISRHLHVRERGGAKFTDTGLYASDIYFISSEGNCPMVDPEFNLYVFNDENVSMINYFTGNMINYSKLSSKVPAVAGVGQKNLDEVLTSGNVTEPDQKQALLLLYSLTDIGLNVRIVNYANTVLNVTLDGNATIADYFHAILRAELGKLPNPTNEFDLKFLYLCSFLYVLQPINGSDRYKFENILVLNGVLGAIVLKEQFLKSKPFGEKLPSLMQFIDQGITEQQFIDITYHNII